MTQDEKDLLLKDLCMRLPYGVIVEIISYGQENLKPWVGKLNCKDLDCLIHDVAYQSVKPYLRPIKSMTTEEFAQYSYMVEKDKTIFCSFGSPLTTDWLLSNHFDYRGLIEKGLAIEVTKENNPYKNYIICLKFILKEYVKNFFL